MRAKILSFRFGIFLLFVLFGCAAQAQTVTYDILLDTDRNTTTGCSVTPIGQGASDGFERRIQAIVDSGSLTVTEVNLSICQGGTFAPSTVIGGPHPVGLNNGVNGTDVVELSTSLASLQPLTNGVIQVTVVAEDGIGSDVLSTTTGNTAGDPILIFIPIAVPALGLIGLLLLIAAIGVITFSGRRRKWLSISLLAASGIVFAANFVVDGNVADWGAVNPDATDPMDDSTNGSAANDLQALFIGQENEVLFFRLDVTDLENAPPIAVDDAFTVLEDGTLNEPAPGVLANDSDPNMDPITAVLMTGPSNAQAFTLNADGSFDYTPNVDFNGTDTFTYVANDGFIDSDPATVTITVTPVNDAPSFTIPADANVLEDAGAQSLLNFATAISAGPPDESGQTLTFNITGNDNAALFSAGPALASDGTLTFTPADDANGTANITVELMDDGGTANGGVDTSAPVMFAIVVDPVNDAPTITIAADADVLEDAGAQSIVDFATNITAGPPDESGQTLTLNITNNDNMGLFSVLPDLDTSGLLTFTPADDANGTANITIELMDDGGTADGGVDTTGPVTFAINVAPVNDEPAFTLPGNPATILEDAGAQTVAGFATGISAGPANENTQVLTFNITGNSNPALFSAAPAIDPVSGDLTYTAADDANGTADITVELMDDGGTADGGDDTSPPQMFTITVTAVNDTPVFTVGTPPDALEDAGAQSIPGFATGISAGPTDESGQMLTFNITGNSNPGLFDTGPALAADGTLTYTPVADTSGAAVITVDLMDDGGVANGGDDTSDPQMFTITVLEVNDAPSFVVGPNQSVSINDGPQSINPWATAISPGPIDEAGQILTFNILSNSAPGLFTVLPAVAADGTLTFTPNPGLAVSGTATIMLNLLDSGGTANGGVDTSPAQSFMIEVLAVLPPTATDDSFDATGNVSITVPVGSGVLTNDDNGGGSNSVTAFDAASTQGGNVSVAADGSFTYDPPPGFTGDDTFNYTVTNSAGSDNGLVTITVADMIWFVDASAAAGGDGRLSAPFNDLAVGADSFDMNAADDPGDNIFMAQGSYQGGLTLLNNQRLIGEGATGTLTGLTGITLAPNSATLPTLGGVRPAVSSVGANGINLGSGNTIRGFNIGNAVDGLSGTNFGTLNASQMIILGLGRSINLDTGNANNVTFDSIGSTNSASEGIRLNDVSGSFTVTGTTNVNNAAGIGVNIQNSSASYTFDDVTINNRGGAGVFINGNTGGMQTGQFGTVTINNQNASGNTAFGMDNIITGGSTITVGSVVIDNGGANSVGVSLSNNDGATININGGSIQNAAAAAFNVSNSLGSATYMGTIMNTAGRSVQVLTNGGGATTTFLGNITDSGTGIFLNNNTGHTITFTGLLDLDTTTNTAFNATGGGTVSSSNTGSTINNTTGIGVNIANTTIGGTGVTFRSISANGASSGIVLNNTGNGGLTVTGDGSNNQNGSGGTISNTTSHGVSLNNTANVTLRSMNISNPGAAANQNGINATELRGSSLIRGAVFTGQSTSGSDYIRVVNSTSNLTLLEVNNSDFTGVANGGNDGILFSMSGNVTARLDVLNNNDFDGLLGDGVQVVADGQSDVTANINGNRFSNDSNIQPGGIGGNSASRLGMGTSDALLVNGGTLTANVIGNTMFDSGVQNGALPVGLVGVFDFVNNQAGAGIINANNNTISAIEEDGGKRFIGDDNTLLFTILVDGNTIDDVNEPGVFFHPRDNTVEADLTIRNNMIGVTTPVGTENANFNEDSIRLFSQDNAGSGGGMSVDILVEDNTLVTNSSSQSIDGDFEDASNTNLTIHGNNMTNNNTGGEAFDLEADNGGDVCLDMNADNIVSDSNTTDDGATSSNSELHLQEDPGTVFQIEDLVGGVAAFLNGRNTLENLDIVADAPNSYTVGGNCTMPALPPAP